MIVISKFEQLLEKGILTILNSKDYLCTIVCACTLNPLTHKLSIYHVSIDSVMRNLDMVISSRL